MDSLALCWAFDARWLFRIPLPTPFLAIWLLLDVLTLIALQVARN